MNDFLKKYNLELPEQIFSTDSSNSYQVVAEKDGAKLAVSLLLKTNGSVVAFILRFIEVKKNNQFKPLFDNFHVRGEKMYRDHEGKPVPIFLGEKHTIPIIRFPISEAELYKVIQENDILGQLRQFISERVELSGGKVTVSQETFDTTLMSKLGALHTESPVLFKLPVVKGYNDAQPEGEAEETTYEPLPDEQEKPKSPIMEVIEQQKHSHAQTAKEMLMGKGYSVFESDGSWYFSIPNDGFDETPNTSEDDAWFAATKHYMQTLSAPPDESNS